MGKTSPLDRNFEQHLIDNRIFIHNYVVQPDNRNEIISKMALPRSPLEESGFTNDVFDQFRSSNDNAIQDATIMSTVLSFITGNANANTVNNLSFGNLKSLTDGSLTKAASSCCDGLRLVEIDLQIRKDLGHYIVPSNNSIMPCLPNFFIEGKGHDLSVAKRRSCYCGTLGARGVYMLRSYVDPDRALDNKAYTVVVTYHREGLLNLFTIHPAQLKNNEIAYYMTLLGTYNMTFDLETFSRGARALRNLRDWAKEQRQSLAIAANTKRMASLSEGGSFKCKHGFSLH